MSLVDALTREMGNKGFRFEGERLTGGLYFRGMGNDKLVVVLTDGKTEADIPDLVKDAEARVLNGRTIKNG